MKNINYIFLFLFLSLLSSKVSATEVCTEAQEPPAGKPTNFDINASLNKFDAAKSAFDGIPNVAYRNMLKASYMAAQFGPGAPYDLKNNPNYMSSEGFGNWFYGAAAQRMGYSASQATRAGSIVQQYQNYRNTGHADVGDLGKMGEGIIDSVNGINLDNPGDKTKILGGYDYSENVYEEDPNSDSNPDSCNPLSSLASTSGYGGGWVGGSSTGFFMSTDTSCILACSSGYATIIDL
ncbi:MULTISPECIES: polymorphic toxin type 44 domain-containing protein [Shewanella]|uniref:Polymorphic toxin type 44 domain-containing protein n=2 Tax=Shewanella TaxID=22 RepID=A0A9X1Z991_9GAMM|nr:MULTISPECIES: polymorphic toxin type 44 domain-containing protein [Shewanella]MCL1103524.1 polymorphic toxin type 44 domain-containing protein [Shewanella saliphila]MCL1107332.1 polymorphic toxin type 44 domain-containing protein [Shewanella algicola]GGP70197.1 hypothetical protein GCM10009409_38550 [Shewanella saliphila]GGP73685.1 hypothetical protein GCM10009347_42490 [Shewanella algicola]